MDKDEILARSRAENQDKDIYEEDILKQANARSSAAMVTLATVFFGIQILAGKGINWGFYALIFSGNMTVAWTKYLKLRQKNQLFLAILNTMFTLACSISHIYNLVTPAI